MFAKYLLILLLIAFIGLLCFLAYRYYTTQRKIRNAVIPLEIFQIWISKDDEIPMLIRQNFKTIQDDNPEFRCKIYNHSDCVEFLQDNYDESIQTAYEKLIPGAFKADFMRYCILYKRGGIYLDAKMKTINDFQFIDMVNKEYFIRDFDYSGTGVWNGFMVCKPQNPKLMQAINTILQNIDDKFYGESSLAPTGPLLLKKFWTTEEIRSFEYEYTMNNESYDKPVEMVSREPNNLRLAILERDMGLVATQNQNRKEKNYGELWNERKIYEAFANMFN